MARLARAVFPGHPHHVTQRGNGRAQTFFDDEDYALYRDLLGRHCAAAGVEIWSWVLMPNHVHLVLVPGDEDGLRRALSVVHGRYAGHIHARLKRTGHFWQGRFGCVAMDETHLGTALRYVALNPVRAGIVERAADWPWSSDHAQLGRIDDGITCTEPVRLRYPDFAALLAAGEEEEMVARLRKAERIGRPIGESSFLDRLERETGRVLKPRKPGPKPAGAN
ncbi:MAG: transposase [Sphingomonas sp.]|jgi:putative transposase|uniref:transposase n=1 Tax=Sphingomonas sp. TaxID=28214 RepID=UPI0035658EF9